MGQTQSYFSVIPNEECDVYYGFNFSETCKKRVGHLTKLSFPKSGKEVTAGIGPLDPEDPSSELEVVGIIDTINWEGGPSDSIQIRARVSEESRKNIQEALSSKDGGAEIDVQFETYEYDTKEKKYFKHFHTDGKSVICTIELGTKADVSSQPHPKITEPINYELSMSLKPKGSAGAQELCIAFGATDKMTRQWGVKG